MRSTVLLALLALLPLTACATLYPPVVEQTSPTAAPPPASTPAAASSSQGVDAGARGARVQLIGADDPDYAAIVGSLASSLTTSRCPFSQAGISALPL